MLMIFFIDFPGEGVSLSNKIFDFLSEREDFYYLRLYLLMSSSIKTNNLKWRPYYKRDILRSKEDDLYILEWIVAVFFVFL